MVELAHLATDALDIVNHLNLNGMVAFSTDTEGPLTGVIDGTLIPMALGIFAPGGQQRITCCISSAVLGKVVVSLASCNCKGVTAVTAPLI